ncbi:glycosyltransferase [Caldichromatium japonicum]|uniref:Cellulose synthase catalytic subunit [UDP-forming] n=1 Tax=Caldichromatium japonicum TaxID=2699430 RepID=A0A6G7VA31_9GAMM|nr:glycosyltransferase family 2 protein [Caldichromatium japonicum]QIK36919.1 glycosyltransferase [Caldichromatium japonicum]
MFAAEISVEYYLTLGFVLLALYSLNLLALALARRWLPARRLACAEFADSDCPNVLVQIPLFNEGHLVERVLAAVMALDWPHAHLEIQILDDSIDGSLAISQRAVAALKQQGLRIELLHRLQRTDFKAGALAAGLQHSDAPFVAIFDADFIPPPDFLRRTVGALVANPDLAYIQTRWGHLNREESLLTRIQARLLDSHFRVEQEARWRLGLPLPFNGTCGLWRRAAIESAGGWNGDSLTEDLDLSMRANLAGWRSAFIEDLVVPGTLPVSARAWRVQQFRWTKGFVQCFIKLMPQVWRSARLPVWHKLMISLQIGQPLAFVVGVACLIMGLPFMAGAAVSSPGVDLMAFVTSLLGFVAPIVFLVTAGNEVGWRWTLIEIMGAVVLTSGLLLSNARGGLEALLGHRTEFIRTPKGWETREARAPVWGHGVLELGVGLALLGFALIEQPLAVIYLAMLIVGLLGIGAMQLIDGRLILKPLGIRH